MNFYALPAVVPAELRAHDFLLAPLTTDHVERDYAAVMASAHLLRRWSQSEWPTDDFTLAENHRDLKHHQEEHGKRVAFTYTVLDPRDAVCLGCIYINPLARLLKDAVSPEAPLLKGSEQTAVITYWVRADRRLDGLDQRLLSALIDWLPQAWSFPRHFFLTNDAMTRQIALLTESGLQLRHAFHRANRDQAFLLYGP